MLLSKYLLKPPLKRFATKEDLSYIQLSNDLAIIAQYKIYTQIEWRNDAVVTIIIF